MNIGSNHLSSYAPNRDPTCSPLGEIMNRLIRSSLAGAFLRGLATGCDAQGSHGGQLRQTKR